MKSTQSLWRQPLFWGLYSSWDASTLVVWDIFAILVCGNRKQCCFHELKIHWNGYNGKTKPQTSRRQHFGNNLSITRSSCSKAAARNLLCLADRFHLIIGQYLANRSWRCVLMHYYYSTLNYCNLQNEHEAVKKNTWNYWFWPWIMSSFIHKWAQLDIIETLQSGSVGFNWFTRLHSHITLVQVASRSFQGYSSCVKRSTQTQNVLTISSNSQHESKLMYSPKGRTVPFNQRKRSSGR